MNVYTLSNTVTVYTSGVSRRGAPGRGPHIILFFLPLFFKCLPTILTNEKRFYNYLAFTDARFLPKGGGLASIFVS